MLINLVVDTRIESNGKVIFTLDDDKYVSYDTTRMCWLAFDSGKYIVYDAVQDLDGHLLGFYRIDILSC